MSSSSSLSDTNSPVAGDHHHHHGGHNNNRNNDITASGMNGDNKRGSQVSSPSSGNSSLPHKLRHKAKNVSSEGDHPRDSVSNQTVQQQLAFNHLRAVTASILEATAAAVAVRQGISHRDRDSDVMLIENDAIFSSTEDMIKREDEDEREEQPRKVLRPENEGHEKRRHPVSVSTLQDENFTLRSEIERLASEVATMKNFLVPMNSSFSHPSSNNNDALRLPPHTSSNSFVESRNRANSFVSSNTTSSDQNEEDEEDTLMETQESKEQNIDRKQSKEEQNEKEEQEEEEEIQV